jgi:hypothetical protein
MFFPKYSNLYKELREILESRAENTNKPLSQGGVGGLSTWIRVISAGKDVEGDSPGGLVMESFHRKNYDKSTAFQNTYGNLTQPGILGYSLDMTTPIKIEEGRGLRPSPVIESLSIEERQQGALKISKFVIKCFTKEQTDEIAKYFLEPGFHVLLEWGWNVADSVEQKVGAGGAITPCDMVQYNNWTYLKEKRKDSKYQYDATLGIVSGGSVKFGAGETYEVEVQLSGVGQVAEYMQVHTGGNSTENTVNNGAPSFEPEKIGKSTPGVALYKQMFNGLPNTKKTANTRSWATKKDSQGRSWAYEGNFVNFDEEVRDHLLKSLTKGTTIRNRSGESLSIPNDTPLFDKERFIRFELAVALFNSYAMDLERKETGCDDVKSQNLTIDISKTVIKAFPHMWSTDKSVLYIPNTQAPNFGLRQALVDSESEEPIKFINFEELGNKEFQANLHPIVESAPEGDEIAELNGSADDPATGQSRPVPFAFPCTYDLDGDVLKYDCDDTVEPTKEKAGFWGWLKDLYINYEFFKQCMAKSNMNSKDVMVEMLNGMSGACNSIWDFQLREGAEQGDDKGPTILTYEDKTFSGHIEKQTVDEIATFEARGSRSPFLSIDWNMSVPGAMQSSVMIKKMSANQVDGSGDTPFMLFGGVYSDPGVFEDQVGTKLNKMAAQGEQPETTENQEEEEPPANARAFDLFANKAGVFSRVQDRKGKIDIIEAVTDPTKSSRDNGTIESLLCVGTWDDKAALKQVELIDKGLHSNIKGEVEKEYTNRVNPIPGLAKVRFSVHGVSGFKVGDMIQFEGIPFKYGPPSFYQIISVGHSMSGMVWQTDITCDFRLIGDEQ